MCKSDVVVPSRLRELLLDMRKLHSFDKYKTHKIQLLFLIQKKKVEVSQCQNTIYTILYLIKYYT